MNSIPALKEHYLKKVVPEILKKSGGAKNLHEVPVIKKVVLNSGIDASAEKNAIEQLLKDITNLAGQKAVITKAKQSISNFKLKQGMPNGVKVTLRGNRMYDFLYRLINIALPVIRDFRGVKKGFDGSGNLTIGIEDHSVFPEIKSETGNKQNVGLNVTIVVSSFNDKESLAFLELMGMAFRK